MDDFADYILNEQDFIFTKAFINFANNGSI